MLKETHEESEHRFLSHEAQCLQALFLDSVDPDSGVCRLAEDFGSCCHCDAAHGFDLCILPDFCLLKNLEHHHQPQFELQKLSIMSQGLPCGGLLRRAGDGDRARSS